MTRKYGWTKADLPDFRDFQYSALPPFTGKIPQVVYLMCPPVQNQEDWGSCVSNAVTTAMEAVMMDEHRPIEMLSRMFAYNNYRLKNGIDLSDDSGASIRDEVKLCAKDGVCHESLFSYTAEDFTRKPPPECYHEALSHRILEYYRLASLKDMLSCLASGYGFIAGIMVYESFESDEVTKTGIIPMPGKDERALGGHAIYVGKSFDQHKRLFGFQNSWGTDWGNNGFGYLPFDYLTNPGLASDFWTVRR